MGKSSSRVTIHDIARAAGVSAPTVSRALNNKPDISEATRQHIFELAEEMGYTPNRAAQMLHHKRSNTIEVLSVGVDPGGMHYRGAHANLLKMASQLDYHAYFSILDIDASRKSYKEIVESILSRQIDGLIITTGSTQEAIPFLETVQGKLPFVCVGEFSNPQYPAVVYNFEYGARAVIEHLVSLGHQAIAEINYTHSMIRHNTWEQYAAEHQLDLVSILTAAYDPEDGYQAVIRLLQENHPFTAILAGNDSLAIGILRALRENGIDVPADVSVTGFDDNRYAAYQAPALTTVSQDQGLVGRLAVEFLVSLIENPDEPAYQRVLTPELVIRESTGAPTMLAHYEINDRG